jgi:predicted glycoside hydrolase/deacetylase ChbG (UPF0249 family)
MGFCTMKKIILCADDYAQSQEISLAILELVEKGILSAVSCMTQSHLWPEHAAWLKAHNIDVGLHFNLTHDFGQGAQSLGQLIKGSLFGHLDLKKIEMTLNKQLDAFESFFGKAPDFVDGHQHVHMFPGIRHVVLNTLNQRYDKRPYIRVASVPLFGHDAFLKALTLRSLSLGFKKQLLVQGFPFPKHFAGLYSLNPKANYTKLMKGWLKHAKDDTLIMCHPGLEGSINEDFITLTRVNELHFLRSEAFKQALNQSKSI